MFKSGVVSRFTTSEHYLECTETAGALAVLTVEAENNMNIQNFLVGLPLHRGYGLIPPRVERLYVVILQFDLQNLIEVQDGFVDVADLAILVDHPCDLSSREKAFSFCAPSSLMETLLLKSPLMIS